IKSLPKAVRRELVPAPDVAREVVAWIRDNCPAWEDLARAGDMAEPFTSAFTRAVRAVRDVVVPPEVWDAERLERLPPHLRVTFRVVEERGTGRAATSVVLDESKDLLLLQRKLAARAEAAVRSAVRGAVGAALAEARAAAGAPTPTPEVASPAAVAARRDGAGQGGVAPVPGSVVGEQTGLTTWPAGLPDGGTLPASVSTDVGAGMVVRGFPALVAEPAPKVKGQPRTVGVALRILADEQTQAEKHAAGVR